MTLTYNFLGAKTHVIIVIPPDALRRYGQRYREVVISKALVLLSFFPLQMTFDMLYTLTCKRSENAYIHNSIGCEVFDLIKLLKVRRTCIIQPSFYLSHTSIRIRSLRDRRNRVVTTCFNH